MKRQSGKTPVQIGYQRIILIISILMAVAILVAITFYAYNSTENYIVSRLTSIDIGALEQNAISVQSNLSQNEKITEYLAADDMLLLYLNVYQNGSAVDRNEARQDIRSRISIMQQFNKSIQSIMIVTPSGPITSLYDGSLSSPTQGMLDQTPYFHVLNDTQSTYLTPAKTAELLDGAVAERQIFLDRYYYAQAIIHNDERLGYLFVFIDMTVINSQLTGQMFLLNSAGKLVGGTDPDDAGNDPPFALPPEEHQAAGYYEANAQRFYTRPIEATDLLLVFVQDRQALTDSIARFRTTLVLLLAFVLILALTLSRVISRRIIQPLNSLNRFIRHYLYKDPAKTGKSERYHASPGRLSLRENLLIYLTCVVIIPAGVILFFSALTSNRVIRSYMIQSYSIALSQTADNVSRYLVDKTKVMKNIIYNISVQQALQDETTDEPVDYDRIVRKDLFLGSGWDDLYLYDESGQIIYQNNPGSVNHTVTAVHLTEAKEKRNIATWTETSKNLYGDRLFGLLLKINSLEEFNNIGFLQSQISEYELENIYKTVLRDETALFIVNQQSKIISHPDKNRIGSQFDGNLNLTGAQVYTQLDNELLFIQPIQDTPWFVVGVYSLDIINGDLRELNYDKIFLFSFVIVIMIIMSFLFAYSLTRSFDRINAIMKRFGIKQAEIAVPQNSMINEVNELGQAFNQMITRNEQLIEQLVTTAKNQAELEVREKKLELVALQYQINPHFLYNSFESINWLVKRNKKAQATQMIESLSQFLRYVAQASKAIVPLRDEIRYTQEYIQVMTIRYGEEIEFIWDLDESLFDCAAIHLSLQPLIENAIHHGIQPGSRQSGVIEITCSRQEMPEQSDCPCLIISVTDNGDGIKADHLAEIRASLNNSEITHKIGLSNIHNRIRLYFGDPYGLTIDSRYGFGTTVSILLPLTQQDPAE
ncbi:MAG: histidine kinase [Bacillota bacterium]|nr:histidine kinase [Bacillota bacterium]